MHNPDYIPSKLTVRGLFLQQPVELTPLQLSKCITLTAAKRSDGLAGALLMKVGIVYSYSFRYRKNRELR